MYQCIDHFASLYAPHPKQIHHSHLDQCYCYYYYSVFLPSLVFPDLLQVRSRFLQTQAPPAALVDYQSVQGSDPWPQNNTAHNVFYSGQTLYHVWIFILPHNVNGSPPENWNRPPGCPRITWLNIVQWDLRAYNLTLNEAVDQAQNRPLWRLMSTYGAMHS